MSRYTGPVCRFCRREGTKLFLKGDKCFTACILDQGKRKSAPGMHVGRRVKISEYGRRLREKQKTKRIAGLTEQQFRHYFRHAEQMPGLTGFELLENRIVLPRAFVPAVVHQGVRPQDAVGAMAKTRDFGAEAWIEDGGSATRTNGAGRITIQRRGSQIHSHPARTIVRNPTVLAISRWPCS